jgi:hypothetical protein
MAAGAIAPLASPGAAPPAPEPSALVAVSSAEPASSLWNSFDFPELLREARQKMPQSGILQDGNEHVARPHLQFTKQERAVEITRFDSLLQIRRKT